MQLILENIWSLYDAVLKRWDASGGSVIGLSPRLEGSRLGEPRGRGRWGSLLGRVGPGAWGRWGGACVTSAGRQEGRAGRQGCFTVCGAAGEQVGWGAARGLVSAGPA